MSRDWMALALFEVALFAVLAAVLTPWMLAAGAVFVLHAVSMGRKAKGRHVRQVQTGGDGSTQVQAGRDAKL